MESRITELEARFTHQEHLLGELSEVLWKQQRQLDALEGAVQLLEKKLGGDPGVVDARQDDKPPHY